MGAQGEQRERRLVFGEDAERYDRARPSYPAALVDDLVGWVGSSARVIDVGCGTGKAARLLAERGMTGVGVEAHPAMAAVARGHLAQHPGWRVDVSDFERWSPTDGDQATDLVTAAQAWHWVDPTAGIHKAHDLLRPGGWLALWWTLADDDPRDVRREIDAVYAEHAPGEPFCPTFDPRLGTHLGRRPEDPADDAVDRGFSPPTHRLYHWTLHYTTAELLDLLGTHSNHRLMEPDQLDRVLTGVAEVVDRHGGSYDFPYVSRLWAASRVI